MDIEQHSNSVTNAHSEDSGNSGNPFGDIPSGSDSNLDETNPFAKECNPTSTNSIESPTTNERCSANHPASTINMDTEVSSAKPPNIAPRTAVANTDIGSSPASSTNVYLEKSTAITRNSVPKKGNTNALMSVFSAGRFPSSVPMRSRHSFKRDGKKSESVRPKTASKKRKKKTNEGWKEIQNRKTGKRQEKEQKGTNECGPQESAVSVFG
eukprot:187941_1